MNQPTDWCSAMVVVPKNDGRVRICVDLTKLNESVKRGRHILPSVADLPTSKFILQDKIPNFAGCCSFFAGHPPIFMVSDENMNL